MNNTIIKSRKLAVLALLLLVPAPTIGVLMAMYLSPWPFGQAVFMFTKIWLVSFPLIWIWKFDKEKISLPAFSTNGMKAACITGLIIVVCISLSYLAVNSFGWIDSEALANNAITIGLSSPAIYLLGAIYWCTINSLIEEYVWRWFVFTRCERLMPKLWAAIISGLFFTIHHIFAINIYFNTSMTVLASIGVFIGGTTWSWIYLRYRNIYASYISHVFADVIIFLIGYQLIFGI